jgi:hypothetical protein
VPRSDQAGETTEQPSHARVSLGGGEEPAEVRATGPERREDRRRDSSTATGEPREHETMTDGGEHEGEMEEN